MVRRACVVGAAIARAAGVVALPALTLTSPPAALHAQPTPQAPVQAPAAGSARGRVVDAETGRPLAGAEVLVLAAGVAAPVAATRTDDDGGWRVDALANGRYQVRVRRLGFAPAERAVDVAAALDLGRLALRPVARDLDATVISAARRIQKLKDAPVAVQLVGREEIARSGASDVATVLTEQAGLQIDGGTPNGAGVMMQGMDAQRVLVLLDGQPLTGRINGNFDLSRVPAAMVSRVEVVKGPQSTLYGSDAMGGVVNIITRDLAEQRWGGTLGARGGTQGRRDVNGALLGVAGPVRWSADVGHRDVRLVPGQSGDLGTTAGRWDGALKARWTPDAAWTVEGSTLLLDEAQAWRTGPVYQFADRRQATGRLAATWARGGTRVQPTLHYSHFDHLFRRSLTERPLSRLGDHDTQRLFVGELLASQSLGRATLDAGTAVRRETAQSDRVVGGLLARTVVEPYAQLTTGGARWSVVPGARVTVDQRWGTFFTPRVAAMLRPANPLAVRLSVGRGFRAPDFKEQNLQFVHVTSEFAYFVRGNTALRPELSTNVSGSVEWTGSRAYLRADLFDNRFRDFIESRIVGDTTVAQAGNPVTYYTYGNVGRGVTRGVDVEGVLRLRALKLDGGYGWLDAFDRTTGRALLGRSPHTARLTLSTAGLHGLSASLGGVLTGRTPVALNADGGLAYRDQWTRVNLRLAQTLARQGAGAWRLEAGATNLFDTRAALWPGFSGRQLYTGLTWSTGRAALGGA